MAKASPKRVVKQKAHALEPGLRELTDQVTVIADYFKAKNRSRPVGEDPTDTGGGPPPTDPPVSPPVSPPPAAPACGCDGLCEFLAAGKPLVKSRVIWNPDKVGGAGWDWVPE